MAETIQTKQTEQIEQSPSLQERVGTVTAIIKFSVRWIPIIIGSLLVAIEVIRYLINRNQKNARVAEQLLLSAILQGMFVIVMWLIIFIRMGIRSSDVKRMPILLLPNIVIWSLLGTQLFALIKSSALINVLKFALAETGVVSEAFSSVSDKDDRDRDDERGMTYEFYKTKPRKGKRGELPASDQFTARQLVFAQHIADRARARDLEPRFGPSNKGDLSFRADVI